MTARPELEFLAPTIAPLLAASDGAIRHILERLSSMKFRHLQLSAAHAGFRPRDLDRSGRRDLLATLRRHEFVPTGLDFWIPTEHYSQPAHVDRAVSATLAAIDLAGDLGRIPVSLILPPDNPASQTVILHADRHGVALADHALPPPVRDGVCAGIDPAACVSRGLDPIAVVHEHAARLVSARLCDVDRSGRRRPLGSRSESRFDLSGYKAALSSQGYQRPVVLDARQWIDPWHGLESSMAAWSALGPFAGQT